MKCIVPLAGPDIILPNGELKALYQYQGDPLISKVLFSRSWMKTKELIPSNIYFVLRETHKTKHLVEYLKNTFEGCKTIILSDVSQGALLTALSGCGLIDDFEAPLCIDLADIIFEMSESVIKEFKIDKDLAGIIPYFQADHKLYSYLKIEDEYVKLTQEKKVISNNASAGVYFFRNLKVFLEAVMGSLILGELVTYRNAYYLCPAYNYLIFKEKRIKSVKIKNEIPLSNLFHY